MTLLLARSILSVHKLPKLLIFPCLWRSGYNLLRDPQYNKGLAFNEKERDAHYLRGLLPPAILSQALQVVFVIIV